MKTKRFTLTKEQQEELRTCSHVRKVSARMVQYTKDFKRHAVSERARGKPPRLIWSEAGIPYHFKPGYAADRISEWRRLSRKHGNTHFDTERRGNHGAALALWRKKVGAYDAMTKEQKIAYLEAENEALEYVRRHFGLPPSPRKPSHSSRRRRNTKS